MQSQIVIPAEESAKQKGNIIRKPGSKKLYIDFRYLGKRIEKTTGLNDTPANRAKVRAWLDGIMERIEKGNFRFAEAFPGASDKEKTFFATREGWEFMPEPHQVLFAEYVCGWERKILSNHPSPIARRDFKQVIDDRLLPYFGQMTFFQISRVEIQQFVSQLKWRSGPKKGQRLSTSRINNILIPLRAIWHDACDEYRWQLADPFTRVSKRIPRTRKRKPEVFRFDEWMTILRNLDPHYRTISEVMLLTGMISSEVAGFRASDIRGKHMVIQNSIVRGLEKDFLKTPYRERCIPITAALSEKLDLLKKSCEDDYHLFTMKSGGPFLEGSFRNNSWKRALEKAGLPYKVPYTMRHTFAAWSLAIGITPTRLVSLMGHGSKKMVYEVYGDYVEGLEEDVEKIRDYFGPDYVS